MPRYSASHWPSLLSSQLGLGREERRLAVVEALVGVVAAGYGPQPTASVLLVGVPCGTTLRPVRLKA